MHLVLATLEGELRQISQTIISMSSEDRALSVIHGQGLMASVNGNELAAIASKLADRISMGAGDQIAANESLLSQYVERFTFLKGNTIPHLVNGNATHAIPAYLATLTALELALEPSLAIDPAKVSDDVKLAKSLTNKLRGLNARVEDLAPKIDVLQEMSAEIVQAHAAADQLPTDLITLREAREEIRSLREMAAKDRDETEDILRNVKDLGTSAKSLIRLAERYQEEQEEAWSKKTEATKETAQILISKCEDAMRTSTSFGLAGAFHDQAVSLNKSMTYWVIGLVVALASGSYFGGEQLHQLSLAIQESTNPMIIWTRLFISLVSVGAPVWFAWMATKQIGQRFRLAEDYAYKASISKAYEGYRREAVELDSDFQAKLFSSALARLDEQPLRFVEHKTHGSPWHELIDSHIFKEAIKIAPELAGHFAQIAKEKVEAAKQSRSKQDAKSQAEKPADDDNATP